MPKRISYEQCSRFRKNFLTYFVRAHQYVILYFAFYLLLAQPVLALDKHYVMSLNNANRVLTFNDISVIGGPATVSSEGEYTLKVMAASTLLYVIKFNSPEGEGDFTINLPYHNNARTIEVYNAKNEKMLTVDVSLFADMCGDKTCQPQESYEDCPGDCPSGGKDDYCDGLRNNKCDPDCSGNADPDCAATAPKEDMPLAKHEVSLMQKAQPAAQIITAEPTKDSTQKEIKEKTNEFFMAVNIALVSLAIVIIVIGIVLLNAHNRARTKEEEALKEYITQALRQGYNLQQIRTALIGQQWAPKKVDGVIKKLIE